MAMTNLTIGQIAAAANLRTSAIRYYESEGLLPPPYRRSGRRVYDPAILDRLALLELGKSAGLTIAELKELLDGLSRGRRPPERWRSLARKKSADLDQRMARIRRMKLVLRELSRCECPSLSDCGRLARKFLRNSTQDR